MYPYLFNTYIVDENFEGGVNEDFEENVDENIIEENVDENIKLTLEEIIETFTILNSLNTIVHTLKKRKKSPCLFIKKRKKSPFRRFLFIKNQHYQSSDINNTKVSSQNFFPKKILMINRTIDYLYSKVDKIYQKHVKNYQKDLRKIDVHSIYRKIDQLLFNTNRILEAISICELALNVPIKMRTQKQKFEYFNQEPKGYLNLININNVEWSLSRL
jgi:hypothetical protein